MTRYSIEKGDTLKVIDSIDSSQNFVYRILKGSVSFGHRRQYARNGLKRRSGAEGTLENIDSGYESQELWAYAHEKSVFQIEGTNFLSRIFNVEPSTKSYVVGESDKAQDEGKTQHSFGVISGDDYSILQSRIYSNQSEEKAFKVSNATAYVIDTADNSILNLPLDFQIRNGSSLEERYVYRSAGQNHVFDPNPKPFVQPNEDFAINVDMPNNEDVELRYAINLIEDPSAEVNIAEIEGFDTL